MLGYSSSHWGKGSRRLTSRYVLLVVSLTYFSSSKLETALCKIQLVNRFKQLSKSKIINS